MSGLAPPGTLSRSRCPGTKGLSPEIKTSCCRIHVEECPKRCSGAWIPRGGSISSQLVATDSVADGRHKDQEPCDTERLVRLRTPLQTSTSTGTSGRGGFEPGRLRPACPPVLSSSCIALGHAQGDSVRSAQNVGTRGGSDPGAGVRSKGGFGASDRARQSCRWRPSRGGCASCWSRCWSICRGSRGVWARRARRHAIRRSEDCSLRLMACSRPMWLIPSI